MCASLVIVADSSRARIFKLEHPDEPLLELTDLVHPESRAHAQTLTSDLPGRSFDSHGQGRHALESDIDVKEQEARYFAEQLAGYINNACRDNDLDRLYITASPHFLGQLRKKLDATAKRHIARQLNKNLVTLDEAAIRRHLF
jgi:protein required for attachment to host cells